MTQNSEVTFVSSDITKAKQVPHDVVLSLFQLLRIIGSRWHIRFLVFKLSTFFFFNCWGQQSGKKDGEFITERANLKAADYITTIETISSEQSRSTRLSHSLCFSLSSSTLWHVVDKARWSLASTERGAKDRTEGGLQLQQRSYNWWDRSVITDIGWQHHLCGSLRALLHQRARSGAWEHTCLRCFGVFRIRKSKKQGHIS